MIRGNTGTATVAPDDDNLELVTNERDRVEIERDDGVRFVATNTLTGQKGHAKAYRLSRVEGNTVTELQDWTVKGKVEAREKLIEAARGE